MFFSRIFTLAALALAPIVSAQTKLQFTSVPGPFTIGTPATIKWTGGSGGSVTLILREGSDSNNLNTIGIIASNIQGNSYKWTPSSALVAGDDYALQITQGVDETNYSGLFSIEQPGSTTIFAAAGSSTIAVSTITPSATSTITLHSSSPSASGTGTNVPRNTTFVSQTLAPTGSTTSTSVSTTTTGITSSSQGLAAQATAQAIVGFGAIAAAAMYLI